MSNKKLKQWVDGLSLDDRVALQYFVIRLYKILGQ